MLRLEVLVKIDRYNVTGLYLQNATSGNDPKTGLPDVEFSFNATGGARFYDLTSQNLPDEVQPTLQHRLGIVLDDKLWTAPNLHSASRTAAKSPSAKGGARPSSTPRST